MQANERLTSYIKAAKISAAEMARRCDYDRSNFYRILKGTLQPTLEMAAKIERETKGVIPMAAWVKGDVA